jgi:uncharacterized protein YggT (Ycf19 family)
MVNRVGKKTVQNGNRATLTIVLIHAVIVYLFYFALFISKWFPYGYLHEIREWLYRFF